MDAMRRLNKSAIRVTDIAAQYWCELQMELYHIHGKKITSTIKAGTKAHEELESLSNVPVTLEPRSYPDYLYKQLYTGRLALETLGQKGLTRELPVFGSINGYKLSGKIDQLELAAGHCVKIIENKTRASEKAPSDAQLKSNKVQLLVYKKMLSDIQGCSYTVSNFRSSYSLGRMRLSEEMARQLSALGIRDELRSLDNISGSFFDSVRRMGTLCDDMDVRYINQFTGQTIKMCTFKYQESEMEEILSHILGYWRGEREALPVPEEEKWKCRMCTFFGKECKVWWTDN